MKSNILLLLKNNLINTYKLRTMTKKKIIGVSVLAIYLIACATIGIGMFMKSMYNTLNDAGLTNYYITLLFSMASIFSFALSIFSTKSGLFDNKDNDLLLSLPIKRSTVLTSRVLMIVIYNFILGLLFIVPGLIVYFGNNPLTFITLISIILLILFFAIIPTILSCLFGYLVAILTSKSSSKSIFELLFYTLFIFIYIIIMNVGSGILEYLISNIELLNILLKTIFGPIYIMSIGLTTNNILYILLFVVINVLSLIIFSLLLNKSYFKIISKLSIHKTNNNFKLKHIKSKSIKKTLLEKEFKKYFSSAIYVFNTIFGVIIIIIASIASFIYSKEALVNLITTDMEVSSFLLVFILLLFVSSLTITTNSSISIEKESFWILKMLPIGTKDIFKAKINLNRIVLIPLSIISLILFKISGYITIEETILLTILSIIYGFFISNFGLIINLIFPKFDYLNDTAIVKQSTSSFVSIMGGVVLFIIIMLLSINIGINNISIALIGIIISLILYIISNIIINKWGIEKFNKI